MSIPAAVFVYILAQNDLFWDKLSLTGCLISNYSWAVLSFENSQPTLGGKILAPIEVQRDETTLLIALPSMNFIDTHALFFWRGKSIYFLKGELLFITFVDWVLLGVSIPSCNICFVEMCLVFIRIFCGFCMSTYWLLL